MNFNLTLLIDDYSKQLHTYSWKGSLLYRKNNRTSPKQLNLINNLEHLLFVSSLSLVERINWFCFPRVVSMFLYAFKFLFLYVLNCLFLFLYVLNCDVLRLVLIISDYGCILHIIALFVPQYMVY